MKIWVGFPPGGSADTVARLLAEKMKVALGQNVVVDNKRGAAGRPVLGELKRMPPDGTNLVLSPSGAMVIAPHLYAVLGGHARRPVEAEERVGRRVDAQLLRLRPGAQPRAGAAAGGDPGGAPAQVGGADQGLGLQAGIAGNQTLPLKRRAACSTGFTWRRSNRWLGMVSVSAAAIAPSAPNTGAEIPATSARRSPTPAQ